MDFQLISKVLFPELILLAGILLTVIFSFIGPLKKNTAGLASTFLLITTLASLKQILAGLPDDGETILFGSFVQDSLSIFFRFLIYLVSFFIVLGSNQYLKVLESPAEYYPILMTASMGAGFLVGVNDFLCFVVALETLGLSAILLSSYARLNKSSNEAGIKYLISSALATAILLLGISFIYGLTGLTNFDAVALRLYQLNIFGIVSFPVMTLIAVCIVSAVAFKLAAAPFHNWSPDVYSGAPTTTTLFLSVVSKTAVLGLAIRLFSTVLNNELITILFAIIAVLSIIVGNYVGVVQVIARSSVKKLLAYSSIAQAGYLIVGLAVFQKESLAGLVMYLAIYALMNTGAFLSAIYFEQITGSIKIYDLAGMIQKRPFMTVLFSLCLINLAGLPFIPAGFIAKFFLFSSAFSSGLGYGKLLAIVGLIGSLIALFYYLYLVKILVVDPISTPVKQLPEKDSSEGFSLVKISTVLTVVLLLVFGIFGMGLVKEISYLVIGGMSG
jgi:NAD(P)H-quinone oxidoreductase subunit 2